MKAASLVGALALAACSCAIAADTREATWLKRPPGPDYAKVWPSEAFKRNIGGRAELDCEVNLQGLLEDCRVTSETPSGMGFGGAAISLSTKFLLSPATVDGKPVLSRIRLPIRFVMEGEGEPALGSRIVGSRRNMSMGPNVLVVSHAIWVRAPSSAALEQAYPKSAKPDSAFGHVVLTCRLQSTGELKACKTESEEPTGQGFAAAAKTLAPGFQMAVQGVKPEEIAIMQVTLPIHFTAPSRRNAERVIDQPDWLGAQEAPAGEDPFPVKAAAAGLTTGRVQLDCTADPKGQLTACRATAEEPAGMGFGAAGQRAGSRMLLNPWTAGGQPADGAHVRFSVRINKPGGPQDK